MYGIFIHGIFHQILYHGCNHGGVGRSQHAADTVGQFLCRDESHIFRVIIVMAEIGNTVGVLDESALQRVRLEIP